MKTQIESIQEALAENTDAIRELTEVMNKGKGGWVVLLAAATVVAWVLDHVAQFLLK